MALTPGTKLGPYEIISPVGAGGMGEVYRSRDTRLNRTVAIKVLPPELSDRPDARERFEREARAISSFSHPNICQLYDVGQQDGISYLVMEFLEGETLADRLRKGPLPLDQVFRYGIDICDGLEKAHRSGVVHRDLKPGNIMLTKSGAKLMDFGLAKPVAAVSPVSGLTASLTSPWAGESAPASEKGAPLTAQGTVVGTFQYMSPEQVEGREADARSDIFALGALLYEMVTGKRAFEGKTAASVLAAVLERQPEPISSVQPMTPIALDRLLRTCLAKDPDERWQTAHDVKLQLKQIAEGGSQASAAIPVMSQRKHRERWAWRLAALLGLLAIAAGGVAYWRSPEALPLLRVQISPPENTQFNVTGDTAGPAVISPDGRQVVFSVADGGRTRLYLRSLDSLTARPLPDTDGATFPFWSPDSRSIAFFTADKLRRIEIAGGQPVTICDTSLGRGGSWGPNGVIIYTPFYNTGIFQVAASGGTPKPITKIDNVTYTSHRWPWFLPDGNHFLYLAVNHNVITSPETGIFYASLDGKENRLLFHCFSNAVFASGRLLFLRENTPVSQEFDPSTGQLHGDPQPLTENVQYDSSLWRANFSVSPNGMMVYASGVASALQTLTWYDRSGKVLAHMGEDAGYFDLALSPDEKKLAVTDANTATATVWVYDLASKLKTRLTFTGGANRSPVWSPDSKQIAFTSNQQSTIAVKPTTGGAEQTQLLSGGPYQGVDDWSPDGRYLMYEQGTGTNLDLWVLPLFGDRKPFPYANSAVDERDGRFSPDGRWVAYQTSETGHPEIFVAPFPWTGAKWQISNGGGALQAQWRRDGKELFFLGTGGLNVAQVDGSGSTFIVGGTKLLFPVLLSNFSREYGATRDGQRFIAITRGEGAPQPLTLVQNWTAELKAK